MKNGKDNRGVKAFLAVIVTVVVAALAGAALIDHGGQAKKPPLAVTVAPSPSAVVSTLAQATEGPLLPPAYPFTSSCGRKRRPNGFNAEESMLGFNGLCIPLAVPRLGYGKWEKGDWVDSESGSVSYCDPAQGCTSLAVYMHGDEYLGRTDCGDPPSYQNNVLVGGYAAVHAFIGRCGANLDQFQHVWVIETPEGSLAVVAESPATMDVGKQDGSETPTRVGESMAIAKVFEYAA